MKSRNRTSLALVLSLLLPLVLASRAVAQTVVDTVSLAGISIEVATNPLTNQVYVPDFQPTTCLKYDRLTGKCTQWAPGWGELTAVNGSTNSPKAIVPASGRYLFPVVVNPVTNQLYAAVQGGNSILVIDSATGTVTTIMDSNATYRALAVNSVTNKIYLANYNTNNVTVIDGATNAITTITDPQAVNPWAVDVNPITNKIYVANNGSANVTVIDGTTNTFTTVPAGNAPFALAVNPITNKIYVVNNVATNGTVTVLDGVTNATATVPADGFPFAIGVNPVTNKLYVANDGTNDITVIDGATNSTSTLTDSTAAHPRGVVVDALTNQTYIANEGSATITVIDGATNNLTTVTEPNTQGGLLIPTSPIAINLVTDMVYVTHGGSQTLTVVAGVAGTGPPDFALAATSAGLTLQPGAQATATIVVGPPFGNTVNLSCTVAGPAPAPTCELSASSVTPSATYGTATLTMMAPAAAAMHSLRRNSLAYAAWLPLMFGIVAIGGSKKRRVGGWLLSGVLLVLLLMLASCGGGGSQSQMTHAPTNYTVTVTGISGAIQHTTQIALTVQ
jgi:YVTN family beta-propeller protein